MATTVQTNTKYSDCEFKILIRHVVDGKIQYQTPVIEEGVTWETERQGSPGKLTFKCFKGAGDRIDKALNFQEGDEVRLYKDNTIIFRGYIFTKSRNKDGWISVTAYDQLRYFKNKDTYVYSKKKANEVLKMIIDDYKLNSGTIQDTGYVITNRVEDNQTLFDIIQNAIDITVLETGKQFVLYDDAGKLCFKDVASEDMRLDLIIMDESVEDMDYSSSIDDSTYNEIELYYDNDETNRRELYVAKDSDNISTWGRLRYTESIQTPTNAANRAKTMLKLYNQKTRKLQIKGAFGDVRCRGGSSVIVSLGLGDINVNNYMVVDKVTHTFKNNHHTMDLTLIGRGEFVS